MALDPIQLYFALPVAIQNALLSLYGVRLYRQRYGRLHRETLAGLLESQYSSAAMLEQAQLVMLTQLLEHAGSTVPRYRRLGLRGLDFTRLDQLRELPMVSKDDLRAYGNEFKSEAYARSELLQVHTGGTTGTPLTVYCDRRTLQRNYAFFSRLREWAGVHGAARVATFAGRTIVPPGQKQPPYWRHNVTANAVLYSSYHISPATIPHYVEHLGRWRPDLIDSYPSSLEPIARYLATQGDASIRPKAVITSSETLSPEVRSVITQAFQAPVFDHYGGAEMAAFVSQCERGSYHVNSEFGIVEILQDGHQVGDGEAGEIVATGFINPIMPLIRYRTGDLAVVAHRSCTCGRHFPTVDRILGRVDDVIVTPEGRRIGRLDPIFKAVSSFYEARIVQDAPDHVRVEYVAKEDLMAAERLTFFRELSNRLGPTMRIEMLRVAQIPRTRGGKLRTVVNETCDKR